MKCPIIACLFNRQARDYISNEDNEDRGEISYDIPYVCNLKRNDTMNSQKRKRFTDSAKKVMVDGGRGGKDGGKG